MGLVAQLLVPGAFAQSKPAVELQGAIAREQVDGDLKTAIAAYQKISAESLASRDVRAKALLHLAGCYEKLGRQAQAVYQQIVRDFGEQPAATQARTRLAALRRADQPPAHIGMTERRVELIPGGDFGSSDTDGNRVASAAASCPSSAVSRRPLDALFISPSRTLRGVRPIDSKKPGASYCQLT